MLRPICLACHQRPAAVNYHNKNKTYYRNRCDQCLRRQRPVVDPTPTHVRTGYRPKDRCELCHFKCRVPDQIKIWYLNGNMRDGSWHNLRSICANCYIELSKKKLQWIDIRPDF